MATAPTKTVMRSDGKWLSIRGCFTGRAERVECMSLARAKQIVREMGGVSVVVALPGTTGKPVWVADAPPGALLAAAKRRRWHLTHKAAGKQSR